MNDVHDRIGLPLKATYCDIKTDPEILKKLGKEDEVAPCYNFLGIAWNLRENTVLPNTYFNLCKKLKGQSGEKKLMDMKPEDFTESFLAGITRRVLSRLAAQA